MDDHVDYILSYLLLPVWIAIPVGLLCKHVDLVQSTVTVTLDVMFVVFDHGSLSGD